MRKQENMIRGESDVGRIAFIIWNSFQLIHFSSLLKELPNALLIIEKRPKSIPISPTLLRNLPNKILYINQSGDFHKIDGYVDILIAQTLFDKIHIFTKTKIVLLQYGYAKEPYNYGAWRAIADLNLVYGEYAYNKISYFSPTQIVGCPRYDQWFSPEFHHDAALKYHQYLDPAKKTVLYAPSWGDLSSFSLYIDELHKLSNSYNILVKLHHNTLLLNPIRNNYYEKFIGIHFFYQDEDLMSLISVSDIVISDFSGAIFDAIFCKKPLVLLSIPILSSQKIDLFSLEIKQRESLGYEVHSPKMLKDALEKIQISQKSYISEALYGQLFSITKNATKHTINALIQFSKGECEPTQQQLYMKDMVKMYLAEKEKNKILQKRKKLRFFRKWL